MELYTFFLYNNMISLITYRATGKNCLKIVLAISNILLSELLSEIFILKLKDFKNDILLEEFK